MMSLVQCFHVRSIFLRGKSFSIMDEFVSIFSGQSQSARFGLGDLVIGCSKQGFYFAFILF